MKLANETKQVIFRINESKKELKSVRSLVGIALLTTLNVVAGTFNIQIAPTLQIGFSSVFAAACGMIFGPVPTALAGIIADHLKFFIHPTGPYFIGFPINEFLIGFIYGCFFYKTEISLKRTICARAVITIFINLTLTSLWLNIMYQSPIFTKIRLIKNIVMFPFDVAILYFILKIFNNVYRKINYRH